LSISIITLLLLVGCQDAKNVTLDTSKLKKVEMDDVTDEQRKVLPITYEAPSVKAGLDALPFEMVLPEKLPFDVKPFQPPIINDMSHDGKNLMVEFKTSSTTNDEQPIIVMVFVSNSGNGFDRSNSEQVKLKNNLVAYYLNKSLSFNRDGVLFTITYMNDNISKKQHKNELTNMANQMI
jgi:hypothetical protein